MTIENTTKNLLLTNESKDKIISHLESLIEFTPGLFLWKDLSSNFLYATQETADLLGYKSRKEIPGQTDLTIPCDAAEFGNRYIQQDRELIKTGQPISILDISAYASKISKPYLARKSLVKNSLGQPYALLCNAQEINRGLLMNLVNFILQLDYNNGKQSILTRTGHYFIKSFPDLLLSERQSECLFYFIRGKSSSDIAKILALSTRTIEDHLEAIKNKLGCLNKSEVIELAINMGFAEYIPISVLNALNNRS